MLALGLTFEQVELVPQEGPQPLSRLHVDWRRPVQADGVRHAVALRRPSTRTPKTSKQALLVPVYEWTTPSTSGAIRFFKKITKMQVFSIETTDLE